MKESMMRNLVFVSTLMNKLLIIPLFFLTMCGTAPVTPPAQACSPPLDGSDFSCPPWDGDFPPKPTFCPEPPVCLALNCRKPKPLLPKPEIRGEVDIYDPMHWHSINQMFIRNARREKIEQNATTPTDAINKALMEFEYGNNGSTKSQELLQLSSD